MSAAGALARPPRRRAPPLVPAARGSARPCARTSAPSVAAMPATVAPARVAGRMAKASRAQPLGAPANTRPASASTAAARYRRAASTSAGVDVHDCAWRRSRPPRRRRARGRRTRARAHGRNTRAPARRRPRARAPRAPSPAFIFAVPRLPLASPRRRRCRRARWPGERAAAARAARAPPPLTRASSSAARGAVARGSPRACYAASDFYCAPASRSCSPVGSLSGSPLCRRRSSRCGAPPAAAPPASTPRARRAATRLRARASEIVARARACRRRARVSSRALASDRAPPPGVPSPLRARVRRRAVEYRVGRVVRRTPGAFIVERRDARAERRRRSPRCAASSGVTSHEGFAFLDRQIVVPLVLAVFERERAHLRARRSRRRRALPSRG